MTCGICDPEAFRPIPKAYVIGYVAFEDNRAASIGTAVRNLYFMGCEVVFTDQAKGHVKTRPGYALLRTCLRKGDRLVLDREQSFGRSRPSREKHMNEIAASGVEIMLLTKNCEALRHAA